MHGDFFLCEWNIPSWTVMFKSFKIEDKKLQMFQMFCYIMSSGNHRFIRCCCVINCVHVKKESGPKINLCVPPHFYLSYPISLSLSFRDLSSNPFICDCKLVRLVSWLQEKGVKVKRPNSMLCDSPPEVKNQPLLNVSEHTCGEWQAGWPIAIYTQHH